MIRLNRKLNQMSSGFALAWLAGASRESEPTTQRLPVAVEVAPIWPHSPTEEVHGTDNPHEMESLKRGSHRTIRGIRRPRRRDQMSTSSDHQRANPGNETYSFNHLHPNPPPRHTHVQQVAGGFTS